MRRNTAVLGVLVGIATAVALWAAEVLQPEAAPGSPSTTSHVYEGADAREAEPPADTDFVPDQHFEPIPNPEVEAQWSTRREEKLRQQQAHEKKIIEGLRQTPVATNRALLIAMHEFARPSLTATSHLSFIPTII